MSYNKRVFKEIRAYVRPPVKKNRPAFWPEHPGGSGGTAKVFWRGLKRRFVPTRFSGWVILLVIIVLLPMLIAQGALIYRHFLSDRQVEREVVLAQARDGAELFAAFIFCTRRPRRPRGSRT